MNLTCRDVMISPDVQDTVHPENNVAHALEIIRKTGSRFLPVVDETGRYLGVFTAPTLLKLILPKAVTIGLNTDSSRVNLNSLNFMSMSKADFETQIAALKDDLVVDNMSLPENIPVVAPDTPIMEGMFQIYKFKRHLILVEPDDNRFVGTVSANSILNTVLG